MRKKKSVPFWGKKKKKEKMFPKDSCTRGGKGTKNRAPRRGGFPHRRWTWEIPPSERGLTRTFGQKKVSSTGEKGRGVRGMCLTGRGGGKIPTGGGSCGPFASTGDFPKEPQDSKGGNGSNNTLSILNLPGNSQLP